MDLSMPRPRVNGGMFPDFQSKSVTVLGIATEVSLNLIAFLWWLCIQYVQPNRTVLRFRCGTAILPVPYLHVIDPNVTQCIQHGDNTIIHITVTSASQLTTGDAQ